MHIIILVLTLALGNEGWNSKVSVLEKGEPFNTKQTSLGQLSRLTDRGRGPRILSSSEVRALSDAAVLASAIPILF